MHPKQFSLIAGIVMLVVGALSFMSSFNIDAASLLPLQLEASHVNFLGLLPMNIINKIALLGFGAGGIAAYLARNTSLPSSINFARIVAIVMIPGAILGLIPATQTMFGYWPLYGGEVIVHGAFGLMGAYFGWMLPVKAHNRVKPLLDAEHRDDRVNRAA